MCTLLFSKKLKILKRTYRVIHQGLDASEGGGVDAGLRRGPVHPPQQLQQAVQPILLEDKQVRPVHPSQQLQQAVQPILLEDKQVRPVHPSSSSS